MIIQNIYIENILNVMFIFSDLNYYTCIKSLYKPQYIVVFSDIKQSSKTWLLSWTKSLNRNLLTWKQYFFKQYISVYPTCLTCQLTSLLCKIMINNTWPSFERQREYRTWRNPPWWDKEDFVKLMAEQSTKGDIGCM